MDNAEDPQARMTEERSPESLLEELDHQEAGFLVAYERIPNRIRWLAVAGFVLVIAVLLAAYHDLSWHWFEVHSGTVNESGPYYGFWSGFGSDLGEATLVAGGIALFRHHNCHVRGCIRLGRPVPNTPYLACPKHHPAHKGDRRAVSATTINRAHAEEQRSPSGPTSP